MNPTTKFHFTKQAADKIEKDYSFLSGNFTVDNDKVLYSTQSCYFFSFREITFFDQLTKHEVTIDTLPYRVAFIAGYNKGVEDYKNDYSVPKAVIYGDNAEAIIKDLGLHAEQWESKSKTFNLIINESIFFDMGYYSGLWNEVFMFAKKNQSIFEKYENLQDKKANEFLITAVERTRLIEIHKYLVDKKYIDVDINSWLYWFSKHTWIDNKKKPSKINWIGAAYHLPNVIYLICGNMDKATEGAMKKAFTLPSGRSFQKLTAQNIKKGVFYKDIENMLAWAERFAVK